MKLATGGGKIDEVFDVMEMLRDEEKDLQGKSGDCHSFHLQHHKFSDDG